MTFVDLTKAFDTVSRDGLWKIMAKFGCPPRYIAMVRQFHDGMQARVQNDGETDVITIVRLCCKANNQADATLHFNFILFSSKRRSLMRLF